MADLAYAFGWTPQAMGELDVDELLVWHRQLERFRGR